MNKTIFYIIVAIWVMTFITVPIVAYVFKDVDVLTYWWFTAFGGLAFGIELNDKGWKLN